MAANRRGRVIYFDSPGVYTGVLEKDVAFTLAYVHLYTDGENPARITVYAGQDPRPDMLIFDSGVIPGEDHQCDWGRGHSEETTADSTEGISVILTGKGARALVYKA